MLDYDVHALTPRDFEPLMSLEDTLFGAKGEKTLGPFYVRLCCDFYGETSFLARVAGEPVGYILSFVREREAYCSTLAIIPAYQRTRVVHNLIKAFVRSNTRRVDTVWYTVTEDSRDAREMERTRP